MTKDKIQTTLKVRWNKKENCFGWKYPCRQGNCLGYDISKFIQELMKDKNYQDFDFKTFKCTIEITKEKYEALVKEPPLHY